MGLKTADHAVGAEQLFPAIGLCWIGAQILRVHLEQRCPVRIAEHFNGRGVRVEDSPRRRGFAKPDGQIIEQGAVSGFSLFQCARLRFSFEGALDGSGQECVMIGRFEHIIVQAGFHGFDRHLFTAGAGEHDDRTFGPAGLDPPQHSQPVRPVQLIIGNDQIARAGFERAGKVSRVAHLIDFEVGKVAAQFPGDQNTVLRVVIHQQNVQRVIHATSSDRQVPLA